MQGKESTDLYKASFSFAASSPNFLSTTSKKCAPLSIFNSDTELLIMTYHQHTVQRQSEMFDVENISDVLNMYKERV